MKQNIVRMHTYHEIATRLKLAIMKFQLDPIMRYVSSNHNSILIRLKDQGDVIMQQQYLKRFYDRQQYWEKIKLLSQYYKYHSETPRIFMDKILPIMQENNQAKRQLEYIKVTEKIKQIAKNQSPKSQHLILSNVLDSLEFTNSSIQHQVLSIQQKSMKRVVSVHSKGFMKGIQPKQGLFINKKNNQKMEIRINQPKGIRNKQVQISQIKKTLQKLSVQYSQIPSKLNNKCKDNFLFFKSVINRPIEGIISQPTSIESKNRPLSRSKSHANIVQQTKNTKSLIAIRNNIKNSKIKGNSISHNIVKIERLNRAKYNLQVQNTTPQQNSHSDSVDVQIKKEIRRPQKRMFLKLIEAKKRNNNQ